MKRAMALCLGCLMLLTAAGCGRGSGGEEAELYTDNNESGYRRTTLYYMTGDGLVAPVMKRIPWEEGIGRAALGYLVDTPDNRRSAAALGLSTVLPEGVEMTLRISDDGVATVDIGNLTEYESAVQERAMVAAVVNTLSEFDSIDSVRMTLNGRETAALPHGTDISSPMSEFALNVEEGEIPVAGGNAHRLTLYFPNRSASLNIPVTRYVDAAPSFATAMAELIEGSADERLLDCFPAGTELNGAYIADGIANVDLSEEFRAAEEVVGMTEAARDSIYLTASRFEEVCGVDIYVDGREYSMQAESGPAPIYVNEFQY